MDGNGIVSLNFFENEYVRFVSAGERHMVYDVNRKNTIYQWVNPLILKSAHMVVEDLYFNYNFCVKHVVPRYFDVTRIFSADNIREDFFMIYTHKNVYNNDYDNQKIIIDFLKNSHRNGTLTQAPMDALKDDYKRAKSRRLKDTLPEVYHDMHGLPLFMEMAENTVFDRFTDPGKAEKMTVVIKKLIEITRGINVMSPSYDIIIEILRMMYVYELLHYQYISYAFIYMVSHIINKYTGHELDDKLYNKVVALIDFASYKKEAHISDLLCRMFDYIAILKILELYDLARANQTKQLVWMCSGAAHNKFVERFVGLIFSYISDGLQAKFFYGDRLQNWAGLHQLPVEIPPTNVESDDFAKVVDRTPEFGLIDNRRAFDVTNIATYGKGENVLSVFEKSIERVYAHISRIQDVIKILRKLEEPHQLILIPLIVSGNQVSMNDLINLLGKSKDELYALDVLIDDYYDLDAVEGQYIVNPGLTGLTMVKYMSDVTIKAIPRYTTVDYMAHPKSAHFDSFKEGVYLFDIKDNETIHSLKIKIPRVAHSELRVTIDMDDYDAIYDIYDYDDYLDDVKDRHTRATGGLDKLINLSVRSPVIFVLAILILLILYLLYLAYQTLKCENNNISKECTESLNT